MARPRGYTQRTSAQSGGPLGLANAPRTTTPGGSGLQQLGEGIERGANIMQRRDEQRQIELQRQTVKDEMQRARLDGIQRQDEYDAMFTELAGKAPEDGAGFTEQVKAELKRRRAGTIASYSTAEVKSAVEVDVAESESKLLDRAMSFQADRRGKAFISQFGQAEQSAQRAVFADTGRYGENVARLSAVVDDFDGLDDSKKRDLKAGMAQRLGMSAGQAAVERSPRGVLKDLSAEKPTAPWAESLDVGDLLRLRSAARSEVNRRDAEWRAQQAEMRTTLAVDLQDSFAARQMGMTAALPSKERFLTAYGAEGATRYQAASQRWRAYDIAGEVAFLPPDEAAAHLASMKPATQEGAADAAEAYQLGVQLYSQQRKALEADPVGVLLRTDPTLRSARETLAAKPDDPAAIDGYFRALQARQQSLGIKEPKLLPEAQREAAAANLTFDPEHPQARVQRLAGLKQAYGPWFGDVVRELAPKLDGHARVLVNMAPEQAMRLDAALAQKADLDKVVTGTRVGDINASLDGELADLSESLALDVDSESRIAEHREAALLLAKSYVLRGSDPAAAAKQAAAAVVNDQYTFRDGLRIPRAVDADAAVSGAAAAREKIAATGGLRISAGKWSGDAGAQEDLTALVRNQGFWVNAKDGGGLSLFIPHRQGMGQVYRADGTPVRFTWAQLTAARASPDAGWSDYASRAPWER